MQPLRAIEFPLQGVRLIEASAGTGKTYTIANLFLRLLLEQGRDVAQILVVTFTNAATEELRERIRRRLREARALLVAGTAQEDGDLGSIVLRVADPQAATRLLQDALTRMDEAAIFTIHGFCQRVLQENAFESGAPFESEFVADEKALRRAALEDFWRHRYYGATAPEAAWALSQWGGPSGLYGEIAPLFGRDRLRLIPEAQESAPLERQWVKLAEAIAGQWRDDGEAVAKLLRESDALSRSQFRLPGIQVAIDALAAWLERPAAGVLPEKFELFTPAKLEKGTKKGKETPSHPLFDLCGDLAALAPRLLQAKRVALLHEAFAYVQAQVATRKARLRLLSYDDLLQQLDAALGGEGAALLAEQIRERFPVAMIDEFQDTDPLQYRIFARVYRERPECGLFMIGDPKQAIYAFRGADIFTYMQAKRDGGGEGFTLDTNWRSSTALVAAVNRLFSQAEAPFLFEEIPFVEVKASGNADKEPLLIDVQPPAPLQVWRLAREADHKPLNKGSAAAAVAAACAREIAQLLHLGVAGRAQLAGRALQAKDIALLVRDRNEAALLREALGAQGIASVYISRESVFASAEAAELRRVLQAAAEPANARLLRAALSSGLLGGDARALESLRNSEEAWEQWLELFHECHRRWREQDFMAMFHYLLQSQGVTHRLLAEPDGERRVTNLLQLGELLQLAAVEHTGIEALLRWFDDQIAEPDGDQEAQQLRLESEASLVQVVTVHRSKGLEYPLVFLPFPWRARPLGSDDGKPFLFHDAGSRALCADLGSDAETRAAALAAAERERLAEDLRLLYVALTRARYRCYLSWGQVAGAADSALAALLHPAADGTGSGMSSLEDAQIFDAFTPWVEAGLLSLEAPPPGDGSGAPEAEGVARGGARVFRGHVDGSWRVTSYSGLVAGHEARGEHPDYDATETLEPVAPVALRRDLFAFPKGAHAGLFLHALLEKLDFPTASGAPFGDYVKRQLERHGFEPEWQGAIETLIGNVLDTPLDAAGTLRLRDLERGDRRDELGFYYPLARFGAAELSGVLNRFLDFDASGPQLSFSPVRGMMKGFIDLVFRHEGRFYLADYKSNHLGDRIEHYDGQRIAGAMSDHRYDLQYLIYTVALHRYLRRRLPDYDYERHVGGVYYLFLRGMRPDAGAKFGIFHDRPALALVEALDRLFAGEGV